MKRKHKILKGQLPEMPDKEIYLNVNALEDGAYELNIVNKNKIIKKTTFKK